jgi:hypothetical protein
MIGARVKSLQIGNVSYDLTATSARLSAAGAEDAAIDATLAPDNPNGARTPAHFRTD